MKFLSLVFSLALAIKFELFCLPKKHASTDNTLCLSQFIGQDLLVHGTVKLANNKPQQTTSINVKDDENLYFSKETLSDNEFTFKTHGHASVNFCFTCHLDENVSPSPMYSTLVDFEMDTGSDAVDFTEIAKSEKLKPMEVLLRRLEGDLDEVTNELQHLKDREMEMRDTNESTNHRVMNFSFLSIGMLVVCAVYQVFYLKRYFQKKRLI